MSAFGSQRVKKTHHVTPNPQSESLIPYTLIPETLILETLIPETLIPETLIPETVRNTDEFTPHDPDSLLGGSSPK